MKQELALKLQNRNWKKKSGCVKWRKCWLASPVTHATCLPKIWRSSAKDIDRNGFTSQPNNGSNSTAQNATWARILVLCPAPLPCTSAWKCTCLAAILCNDKKLSSGSFGGTICMISMWCSGLKSNMQTSYLHISMVTLLPFQVAEVHHRVSEINLLMLTSFLAEEREVLKGYQKPHQHSTLGVNSSGSISKSWVRWGDRIYRN